MATPTFRMGLPTSVNPKHPHRHTHGGLTQLGIVLGPVDGQSRRCSKKSAVDFSRFQPDRNAAYENVFCPWPLVGCLTMPLGSDSNSQNSIFK